MQFHFTENIAGVRLIGFALLRSVIGLENSRHPLNQSDAKLKPIATWSFAFSRACVWLRVFTLSSHWLLVIFIFALIGRCEYFGFGFTTLNPKALYGVRLINLHTYNKGFIFVMQHSALYQQELSKYTY